MYYFSIVQSHTLTYIVYVCFTHLRLPKIKIIRLILLSCTVSRILKLFLSSWCKVNFCGVQGFIGGLLSHLSGCLCFIAQTFGKVMGSMDGTLSYGDT